MKAILKSILILSSLFYLSCSTSNVENENPGQQDGGSSQNCGCMIQDQCYPGNTDNACGKDKQNCSICVSSVSKCVESECKKICTKTSECLRPSVCIEKICIQPWERMAKFTMIRTNLPRVHSSYDDDTGNAIDVYVILEVDGKEVSRTSIINNASKTDTKWEDELSFKLKKDSTVKLLVWDSDKEEGGTDDFVGGIEFTSGEHLLEIIDRNGEYSGRAGSNISKFQFKLVIE